MDRLLKLFPANPSFTLFKKKIIVSPNLGKESGIKVVDHQNETEVRVYTRKIKDKLWWNIEFKEFKKFYSNKGRTY